MVGQEPSELQQLDSILRSCEERFHAVFNLSAVGMAQLSLGGRWLVVNQKLCEILGYDKDELRALSAQQLCHPDDLGLCVANIDRLLNKELTNFTMEKRFIRKDGSVVWVNLNMTLLGESAEQSASLVAVVEDISERKRAEEELRQSEERLSKIFELAPIAIIISTLADGQFLEINKAGEGLLGYRRDEVVGHRSDEFRIWKETRQRAGLVREVLEKGAVRDQEVLLCNREGRSFWASYSGVVVEIQGEKHLLSLLADIDERKCAESALRVSEERFRLVADHAPVLIWAAGSDSNCTFVNKTWLDYTGRTLEQELGTGWTENIHPDDSKKALESYLSACQARRPFSIEYRLHRRDDGYGWIIDTGVPHLSPEGELLGYVGTAIDITEEKRAKEQLQQDKDLLSQRVAERTAELTQTVDTLQAEINERIRVELALQDEVVERHNVQAELREKELLLLHQSRLAAMGEMVGNIAHQWRQPLNHLGLVAQELAMTYKKGVFDADYLDASVRKILETIRHMSQTIEDFRNFFSPNKGRGEFLVAEAIRTTLSLLEGSLKSQQIRTEVSAQCGGIIRGELSEFSQVLLNIIVNARDAFAERQVAEPTIWIDSAAQGDKCVITIRDNAGGIPEEIMDKIFDPYFSTKGPEKGTGVGLFMSRAIIEKNMGGRLTVRNAEGGAEFRIEI